MDDKTIQRKLDQLVSIANELGDEAKRRYGPEGSIFYESEGSFHMMDGDTDEGVAERQAHIKFTSRHYCTMGCGSW